jgi:hypothetical protein
VRLRAKGELLADAFQIFRIPFFRHIPMEQQTSFFARRLEKRHTDFMENSGQEEAAEVRVRLPRMVFRLWWSAEVVGAAASEVRAEMGEAWTSSVSSTLAVR